MADRDRPTPAAEEGFLRRWSRRKAQARSAPVDTPAASEDAAPAVEVAPASSQDAHGQAAPVDPKDLPDIESLEAGSDFSVFMRPGVPAHLRTLALRKLWRSDPLFSKLDGLVEYGEDYTLPSWPKGTIKTAYQVGRGFVKELEKLVEREAEPAPAAPPPDAATSEAAPSIGARTADERVAALAESPQPAPEAAGSDDGRPAAQPAPGPGRAKAGTPRRPRPLPRRG